MVKKIGKIIGLGLISIIVISVLSYLIFNEELPQGIKSVQADSLAMKLLRAINHEHYQNTRYLEWSFAGHHYLWDKQQHQVVVSWKDNEVHLLTKMPDKSTVEVNGEPVEGRERTALIEKATFYFNNDSFWLVAPHKIFDPGTERRLIQMEDGSEALLVTYTSGGSTPGDSYLWLLDESGLPYAWKLWVCILPIGGLETTWEDWKTTTSGTLLPTMHKFFFIELKIGGVRGWNE
ncbi:MAG: hypothetical protein RLO17_15000 [Cyclobacteriaceae bacterium]